MDFLDLSYELKNARISLRSNSESSTLYIEEIPDYTDISKKLAVLSVYFYFRGDEQMNPLSLFESLRSFENRTFHEIKTYVLESCSKIDQEEWSHSLKNVDVFSIKPRKGYKFFLKGNDFFGFCLWGSFFFVSEKRDFCLSKDKESAQKLLAYSVRNPDFLKEKPYLFLIKFLYNRNIHFLDKE